MIARAIAVVLFCFIFTRASASAGAPADDSVKEDSLAVRRASLRMSLLYEARRFRQAARITDSATLSPFADEGKRIIPLAFGLSAILPGAGQVYNKQWIKAAITVSIEAALIVTYISKKDQGEQVESDFIAFANQDWDPVQYGDWLNDYTVFLNAEFGAGINVPDINTEIGVDFQHPELWSGDNWQAVRTMFAQINATERSVFHPETGASFSHQLPRFSSQQYYELVGKYFQFAPGWSDYSKFTDADGNFTVAIDPEHTGPDGSKPNVSEKFFNYAEDHAESQDFLRSASQYGILIVLNHVVAAIDAAVVSKLHNDRIMTLLSLSVSRTGSLVPVAGIGIRL